MPRALGVSGGLRTCSCCLWGWAPAFLQAPNKAMKQPDDFRCAHLYEPPLPLSTPELLAELGFWRASAGWDICQPSGEVVRRPPRGSDLTTDAVPLMRCISTLVSGPEAGWQTSHNN